MFSCIEPWGCGVTCCMPLLMEAAWTRVRPCTQGWGGSGEAGDPLWQSPSPGATRSGLGELWHSHSCHFQVVWNLIISLNPCHLDSSSDLTGCVPVTLGSGPKSFVYFNLCADCKSDDHHCTSLQPAAFFPTSFSWAAWIN